MAAKTLNKSYLCYLLIYRTLQYTKPYVFEVKLSFGGISSNIGHHGMSEFKMAGKMAVKSSQKAISLVLFHTR